MKHEIRNPVIQLKDDTNNMISANVSQLKLWQNEIMKEI
jgi:hypothetical protein